VALDAFRGLTMASMVFVNNPGDWGHVYAPLLHARWDGWTPTDLIFPFFLFIVGVSMTLSRSTMGAWTRILRRSAIIFGLGLFLAGFPYFRLATIRIPGVLQRIAVCYLAAAFLYRWTAPAGSDSANALRHAVRLLLWAVGLTLGYWLIMAFVPPPGGVAGDLSPSGNLGAYLDRMIFGPHLWKSSKTWDPEGLLSTVPAVGTTLLGGVAGIWLRSSQPVGRKAAWLALAGVAGMLVGGAWNLVFPINKSLWTGSYVWFTAGGAAVTLAACVWLIDGLGWKAWSKPLVILGLNAITLFVLSGLIAKSLGLIKLSVGDKTVSLGAWLYVSWFVPLGSPKNTSLLYAAVNLLVLFGILYVLYRRRIFLKA
jgi:predicted acyltransferase